MTHHLRLWPFGHRALGFWTCGLARASAWLTFCTRVQRVNKKRTDVCHLHHELSSDRRCILVPQLSARGQSQMPSKSTWPQFCGFPSLVVVKVLLFGYNSLEIEPGASLTARATCSGHGTRRVDRPRTCRTCFSDLVNCTMNTNYTFCSGNLSKLTPAFSVNFERLNFICKLKSFSILCQNEFGWKGFGGKMVKGSWKVLVKRCWKEVEKVLVERYW